MPAGKYLVRVVYFRDEKVPEASSQDVVLELIDPPGKAERDLIANAAKRSTWLHDGLDPAALKKNLTKQAYQQVVAHAFMSTAIRKGDVRKLDRSPLDDSRSTSSRSPMCFATRSSLPRSNVLPYDCAPTPRINTPTWCGI